MSQLELFDLSVVAAGKGEIVGLFNRDPERSPYSEAQRKLAVAYVDGLKPPAEFKGKNPVNINLLPGPGGELFIIPALTTGKTGPRPCHILFFEAVPGGELDRFSELRNGEEHLKMTLELMKRYAPWEHWRARDGVTLTDRGGYLAGHYAPTVRKPVASLGGGLALGMAAARQGNRIEKGYPDDNGPE